ncbi:MAG: SLBB domain-containing protein [Prevotella sp.]|nr:SLBB domain-containing protein [Prevotella sp.]
MKKILLILLVFTMCATTEMVAQSMTDSQIISFIQKEQKKGTSQAQIVTKLMQKGVSVTKLQKLRRQYASAKSSSLGAVDNEMKDTQNRSRVANGETYSKNETMGKYYSYTSVKSRMTGKEDMTEEEINESRMQEEDAMLKELNGLTSDETGENDVTQKGQKKVFGRDIFNKKNLSFEPNMNIATPQNYVLGPGDAVFVDIYGASQKSVQSTVSPDGFLNIEGFGPVQVSGLTVNQANARLRSTLGARYSSSNIKLTVGQTRTIMVNVMGEVKAPGTYTLSAFASVFHALYMAGGTSEIGTLRNIKVYRAGRLVSNVDIYDYILNGKLTGNVRLADNDVIVVGPYDCLVNITGKVKRPMYYEMKKSENVQTLIKYAGGFAGDAYTKSVRLLRKNGKEYGVYNVTEFDMASFRVSDEDSVSVDSILLRYSNTVELKGAAFRPGKYQFGGDVTTVKGLLEAADGLREDAFTKHAVMHRMKPDRTLEVMAIDVQGILDGTVADVPLCNEDVLFIPSRKELTDERKLKIFGEVYYPGTYQYADGMTVEDFILQAGGLKETASTVKVNVSRRIIDPKATETGMVRAQTFEMSLVDGFVVDGQSGFKLQPFDEVYVRKSPGYSEQANVEIDGEVMFRGYYTLQNKVTRLSDVVKMAGGLTADAYARGAKVERKMTDEEKERAKQLVKMMINQQNPNEAKLDSLEMAKRLDVAETYYVGIELDKALKEPGCDDDIILREGDKITVPQYDGTVKINGEVMYPNTVAFEKKHRKADYYISQAGGVGNFGKKSRAYIIYQNGMVGKVNDGAKVEPGCEIVIPRKKSIVSPAQNTTMWVSVGSTLATMAAVIVSALK